MITKEEVTQSVLGFVSQLKKEMDLDIEVSEETVIIGEGSEFDSMVFLDLIGLIEDWIDVKFDLYISVASDDEDFDPDGPFGNVKRLSVYLTGLINSEKTIQ